MRVNDADHGIGVLSVGNGAASISATGTEKEARPRDSLRPQSAGSRPRRPGRPACRPTADALSRRCVILRACHDRRERCRVRLRGAARCADPLSAADAGVLPGAGIRRAVRMGALRRRAVSPAAEAAVPMPRRADHHGGALSAGRGRPGSRRAVQRESEVLRRLLRRFGAGPRPAHRARRHRPQAHDRRGSRHLLSARRTAPARRRRPHRVRCAAVSRRPDEPQPSRDAGAGLSGDRRPLQGRRRRRRDPGSQLPGLPPDA